MIDKDDYFQAEYIDRDWFNAQLVGEWTVEAKIPKEELMWKHYRAISPQIEVIEGQKCLLFFIRRYKSKEYFECDIVQYLDGVYRGSKSGQPFYTKHSEYGKLWFIRKLI